MSLFRPSKIKVILWIGGFAVALALVYSFMLRVHPGNLEVPRAGLLRRDELWYQIGRTNPFTGVMIEFYSDGALLSRSMISNGQLNGLSEGWHTNGQMQIREYYSANLSDGLRTKWYPDGNKFSEAMIVQGKIEGTFRRWHENGTLAEEIEMCNGKPDGVGSAYYKNGSLKTESQMRNGQVIKQTSWKEGERQPN